MKEELKQKIKQPILNGATDRKYPAVEISKSDDVVIRYKEFSKVIVNVFI